MRLVIPGEPVAKARPRMNRKTGVVYTPKRTKSFETLVKEIAYEHFEKPLEGAVSIYADFYFPRPKNRIWKKKPMPREWKTTRPDIDNLFKSLLDGLNGIAFRDDAQIVEVRVKKFICSGDDVPHTEVEIKDMG